MIDEEKTFETFGYISTDLTSGSCKRVWAICNECGINREITFRSYRALCLICAHKQFYRSQRGPFNIEYFNSIQDAIENDGIDELRTFKDFGYYSIDLSKGSRKQVWVICNNCKFKRTIMYRAYIKTRGRCKSCAHIGLQVGKNNAMFNKPPENYPMFGRTGKNHPMYGKRHTEESCRRISAGLQHIAYEEWESFAINQPYCPLFNESCRESNREKYDRACFICGKPEIENTAPTGKYRKLSVHHVDMNKAQGCDGHEWKLIPVCMHCHGKLHSKRMQSCIEYILKEE